jgi:molecular chaperone HscB
MTTTPCWSCAQPVDLAAGAVTCAACGAVQPVDVRVTPFARLGLEMKFGVDDKALDRAWMDRSRKVHPDRFAAKSDKERRFAVEQTAALNEAKRAIADPFDRATWLVTRAGVSTAKLDQALLVELMEARESAEESSEGKARVIADARARFERARDAVSATLAKLDAAADGYAASSPELVRVAQRLAEMKTLARLVDDLGGPRLIATLDAR